jgi:hypothetical protein
MQYVKRFKQGRADNSKIYYYERRHLAEIGHFSTTTSSGTAEIHFSTTASGRT